MNQFEKLQDLCVNNLTKYDFSTVGETVSRMIFHLKMFVMTTYLDEHDSHYSPARLWSCSLL